MSYFMTITFDLRYAEPAVYKKIQAALEEVDFSKFVVGRKRTERQLPANTFVAEFDIDDFEHKREAIEWAAIELKRIFDAFSVRGKYFISIGRNWIWKTGDFGNAA